MKPEKEYHKYLNEDESSIQGEVDDVQTFLARSAHLSVPESGRKELIWEAIEDEISEDETVSISFRNYWIAASISFLLVLGAFAYFVNNVDYTTSIASQFGKTETVNLQDGSKVTLNAGSQVSFARVWDRNITLDGEAFFEVSKGETFTVHTPNGTVTVLGTSFNVLSRGNRFAVACKTGKVKVGIESQSFELQLSPGDGIVLENGEIREQLFTINSIGLWQTGVYHFDDQPVEEVFSELERQFDVEVKLARGIDKRFSGYFSKIDLEEALTMICEPLGLQFKIGNNKSVNIQLK